jgi:hypothetical protein
VTFGFGNQYSIQLSYGRELRIIAVATRDRPTTGSSPNNARI